MFFNPFCRCRRYRQCHFSKMPIERIPSICIAVFVCDCGCLFFISDPMSLTIFCFYRIFSLDLRLSDQAASGECILLSAVLLCIIQMTVICPKHAHSTEWKRYIHICVYATLLFLPTLLFYFRQIVTKGSPFKINRNSFFAKLCMFG